MRNLFLWKDFFCNSVIEFNHCVADIRNFFFTEYYQKVYAMNNKAGVIVMPILFIEHAET